jgi:N-acetylglucosamine kinase-like BadF-type ATPase
MPLPQRIANTCRNDYYGTDDASTAILESKQSNVEHASEQPETLILGVDGGNTKTVAIVATTSGHILGAGRAGRSDIYNTPTEEHALQEIASAVQQALQAAGASAADLEAAAFCMAGADWPEDVDLLQRGMTRFGFGRKIVIANDAIGALRAGTPDGVGVAITCGTGIAIGARNRDGREWYLGNWTVAIGGYELGKQALTAIYEAHLGLGPQTSLTSGILNFFDADSVEHVLHYCTARNTDRHWLHQAKLAPILMDEAANGDAVALAIIEEAGKRDARVAAVAARAVGLDNEPFQLVLSGGVLRHPSQLLSKAICRHVATELPQAVVCSGGPEPVIGAVLMARDALGLAPDGAVQARLEQETPGSWLFAT